MFGRRSTAAAQTGEAFDLWGAGSWCNQEVVGESHYLAVLEALFGKRPTEGEELLTVAVLVPEPENRFDRNAVAVQIGGTTIGYLPREIAAKYQPLLVSLAGQGQAARVPARVWGGIFRDYESDRDRFNASVTVALAEPHLCLPLNRPPDTPHEVLPTGRAIQLSGEEKCMEAIAPWLRPEGEAMVYAELRVVEDQSGRITRQIVEVSVDGRAVGTLTPKMSGELIPVIEHLSALGLRAVSQAKVKGNRLKAEVSIHCLRAHELPSDWLNSIQPVAGHEPSLGVTEVLPGPAGPTTTHGPIPPKPQVRFVAPPGWPQPPDGWEPEPGWRPDPAWPAAPADWIFWRQE